MTRVTCRDLDPARRVSAKGEISGSNGSTSMEALFQGEKRVSI